MFRAGEEHCSFVHAEILLDLGYDLLCLRLEVVKACYQGERECGDSAVMAVKQVRFLGYAGCGKRGGIK